MPRHRPYIPEDKKPSARKTLADSWFALRWIFRISKPYFLFKVFFAIDSSVILILEKTFLISYIIKIVEEGRPFVDILPMFLPVTAVVIFNMLFTSWMEVKVMPKWEEKINKEIRLTLYEKAAKMDMAKYDDPTFYNDFVWAMQEAPPHMFTALSSFCTLCSTVAVILLMGGYVIATDPIGLIFLGVTLLITVLLGLKSNKRMMQREEERIPHNRRAGYIKRVFYLADYAKDLRMGEMKEMLYEDYAESEEQEKAVTKKHAGPLFFLGYLRSIFWDVIPFDCAYMTYLLYQTLVVHALAYSELYALYRSVSNLQYDLTWMTNLLPEFQQHAMYIGKIRTFLETENTLPDNGKQTVPTAGDLKLSHVVFAYPNVEEPTLRDISLTIPHGAKIAFVGYNGAGKSTLVKLLMRLYDPSEGTVSYGDCVLPEYPLADYRSRVAVLFQDYQIIAATLAQNVTMGADVDEARVREVLHKVGFDEVLEKLPLGIHTPLTKEFDDEGVNLSGGEAQKIAIARVLYSNAQVLILDEPSSALDPLSEYRLNQTIRELASDKTVIFISHRLSTTRMADTIFMLENGTVIEQGSHNELMAQGGKYAEMFNLQAEKYR
ncbi:MAG: ABC transporter ATP-binding protein [Ruminococcaceae bacterium]|nr:ABC transporter ATP-binding protein [Oscillospiraceae bacterium]